MSSEIDRVTRAVADKYAVQRELGQGGMATVYLAHDLKHHRSVAIKLLHPDLAVVVGAERFLQEINVTANLQHPHILPLFDSGSVTWPEGTEIPYYVMPFVEGESLRDRIDRDGPLPIEDALAIVGDVAAALTYAHARGVVHRDIKPENILIEDGEALVADFGIALGVSSVDRERLTATGLSIGTPAYMSPEQIGGGAIDGRGDEYSLACVLFEMLVGEPPFTGPNAQFIIAQALTEPPPSVRARRPDVLKTIDAAIDVALAKQPDDRFASPREFYESCQPVTPTKRARGRAGLVAGIVGALAIFAAVMGWRSIQVSGARASLLRIGELAQAGEYVEAYELALEAEGSLPDDSMLAALMSEVSARISITSDPSGADVYLRAYAGDGTAGDSVRIGTTPIEGYRIPGVDHRVTVALAGYGPATRIVSSAWKQAGGAMQDVGLDWAVTLLPVDQHPVDMVFIPGSDYVLVSPDAMPGTHATLDDFFLDRFETTNEAFSAFVAGGGYRAPENWSDVPDEGGTKLVDRTGLPGPRSWLSQTYPEGRAQHPVTDVTWFEAQSYCRSVGKRLPTVYEWEKAARDGVAARTGIVMPWGLVRAAGPSLPRANFNSDGTTEVDSFLFGVSAYGAHHMAGNVKEWLANPMGDGYVVTGGSWEDPAYLYTEYGEQPAMHASSALGFRCARTVGVASGDQGGERFQVGITPTYTPVSEAEFRSFLSYYQYDRRAPNPRFDDRVETNAWVRERIWIDGLDGDSLLVYFYTPRNTIPPYQTILYVGSSAVFCCESLPTQLEWAIGPVIQGGRAVLGVVLRGMVERPWPNHEWPEPNSVQFRDEMVLHATELRLGLDYLETRTDVDMDKVAYTSVSFGGGSRLPFSAVDDRYSAVVYIGGGIDERVKPTLPEADNVNFAPYVSVPKLLLNGRNDEEHPWLTRALPLWNLLREPRELALIDGAGHVPPLDARIPAITRFLDARLGRLQGR